MTTYGLYTKDLRSCAFKGHTIEACRRYKHGEYVICSEKTVRLGFEFKLEFRWRGRWRLFFFRHWQRAGIGPFEFGWGWLTYQRADKIVEE